MKSTVKALALLVLFGTALAFADSQPGQFEHVIIVVQENRTPDNLFGGVPPQGAWQGPGFEQGVDLTTAPNSIEWSLGACFDPGHENGSWQNQWASGVPGQTSNPHQCGQSQGNGGHVTYCCSPPSDDIQPRPVCGQDSKGQWVGCSGTNPINVPVWPEETYVSWTYEQTYDQNGAHHVLDPYVQIATQYGYANYFYQTNQGPSEPAHDFLFGGTSAPTGDPTQLYYNWFDVDNPGSSPVGCESTEPLELINPDGNVGSPHADPYYGGPEYVSPCFDHPTLVDLLNNANPQLTWNYYTASPDGIWTAPNSIKKLCQPDPQTLVCTGPAFTGNPPNVVHPPNKFFQDFPSGGTNILSPQNCKLPNVAWIIPDGSFSDHPGLGSGEDESTAKAGGPNWVASIVNAVGNATCTDEIGKKPWQDTVILIVWDDWGGWYDHVMENSNGVKIGTPYQDNYLQDGQNGNPATCIPTYTYGGAIQYWGCGYTYGFRVPFMVVSAYTPAGTVSGSCTMGQTGQSGTCYPPFGDASANAAPHQHDFGSILAFIEFNFGLGIGCINSLIDINNNPCNNTAAGGVPFADYYAPEAQRGYAPLGDFFTPSGPRGFTSIPLVNNSFSLEYFKNFNGPFTDPDNDMIDND